MAGKLKTREQDAKSLKKRKKIQSFAIIRDSVTRTRIKWRGCIRGDLVGNDARIARNATKARERVAKKEKRRTLGESESERSSPVASNLRNEPDDAEYSIGFVWRAAAHAHQHA